MNGQTKVEELGRAMELGQIVHSSCFVIVDRHTVVTEGGGVSHWGEGGGSFFLVNELVLCSPPGFFWSGILICFVREQLPKCLGLLS